MNRGVLSQILRKLGLSHIIDNFRFKYYQIAMAQKNKTFLEAHPDVILPPDYLMYESFKLDYERYYMGGRHTAEWVVGLVRKHLKASGLSILDWGCGPGRVIRHMPIILSGNHRFFGTDYNKESIEWCKKEIQNVSFHHNAITANLSYDDNSMDLIYGISIITHLSESLQFEWVKELHRILKIGGIILVTTQGDNFKVKLSPSERKSYDAGFPIIRGRVKEGHRTFSSFHPDAFLYRLFEKFEIIEKIVIDSRGKNYTPQDTWILRKKPL